MDADDVAEELYGLPPEEFMAARREREAEARAAGDRALAKEIAALAKPSTAAWVCNLLAREQHEEIEGLVELGGLLREAQENLAGDEVRALDVQRRRLVAALARQGRGLAHAHGHAVSTAVADQVEETLRAALADPDAADALTAGRLTTALSYSGLGAGHRPDLRVVRPQKPAQKAARKPADGSAGTTARRREREDAERRAAEERRRRELERARRAVDEAAEAAEQAQEDRAAEESRVARLRDEEERLRARVDELTEELTRAREECTRAGTELSRAERRQKSAVRRAADAAAALDRARASLGTLESGGRAASLRNPERVPE